jgi:putative thiamine transport system permease protein
MGLWLVLERAAGRLLRWWAQRGRRSALWHHAASAGAALALLLLVAALLAMLGLALWSVAAQWRYPSLWPQVWTWANWQRQASSLALPLQTTLSLALVSALVSLGLVVACLEGEAGGGTAGDTALTHKRRGLFHLFLYLPLLLPQVAFLFGLQVLLVRLGADGQWWAVLWAHTVFVLPYLYLSLADPWRALDGRYLRAARSLGASRWRVLWRVKLPLLLRPLLLASAVGFAVSVGLYLPTVFAGAGRVATLTTEAITLQAGADRRVTGVWALLQALFPFVAYTAAALLPRWVFAQRLYFK